MNIEDFAGQLEYTVTHQFFLSFEVCHSHFLYLSKALILINGSYSKINFTVFKSAYVVSCLL